MAYEVIMPKAGMSMETGTIVQWLKQVGEAVNSGDPLLEIETDKVNMEVEALYSGYLLKTLYEAGDVVPVTQVIAYIGGQGESAPDSASANESSAMAEIVSDKKETAGPGGVVSRDGERIPATPLAKTLAAEKGVDLAQVSPSGKQGEVRGRDIQAAVANIPSETHAAITPLAKKIAQTEGVPLESVSGSGVHGKIVKQDIINTIRSGIASEQKQAAAKPLAGMRKVIAHRMLKSHLEIPPVTMNTRADVTELIALRKKINDSRGLKITFNDFVLCAVSRVFAQMPQINLAWAGEGTVQNDGVHIGMAVALENGLIVPVIRNTDKCSLSEISAKAKSLAEQARQGRLAPDDYQGGTFTVSNLGMYGIRSFTPIINQPETMILGVCAIEPLLTMDETGKLTQRNVMGLSLTFDHRAMDGAQAAVFLQKVVTMLEQPLEMLV